MPAHLEIFLWIVAGMTWFHDEVGTSGMFILYVFGKIHAT